MAKLSPRHLDTKVKRFLYVVVLMVSFTLTIWFMDQGSVTCTENCAGGQPSTSKGQNEDQVVCKFPQLDPFSAKAMSYYEQFPTTTCPDGLPTVTYYDGNFVRVNQTRKQRLLGNVKLQCWSRSLTYMRWVHYVTGEWKGPFDDNISFEKESPEFVEVKCRDKQGKLVSKMHHYATRDEIRKKMSPVKHKFKDEQMNVMLIGMDSLSSHLFKRAMPKTREVLLKTIGATEMNLYNKIGDNTFPNLLAIASGCYEADIPGWSQAHGFDPVPFAWNDFKKAGFRTQYMSDRPDFDDFDRPPTDSYNPPMVKALMEDKIAFDNNCFEDQIEVNLWLNLLKEFALDSLHGTGRFYSLAMLKRPSHDFPNQASAVDVHYANFLNGLWEDNILNNTLLVFFGDHGQRKGSYRETYEGSIEERAANMVIAVPNWFKLKYQKLYQNLLTNANRLTTNFDIHYTIKLVLNLNFDGSKPNPSGVSKITRGLNLFSEIPPSRTCADASITAHFCMCNGGVPVKDPYILEKVGHHVVNEINSLTMKRPDVCARLELSNVTSVILLSGAVGWSAVYRIMLTTVPGGGAFEATVAYSVKLMFFSSIESLGMISRISTYRGLSDCVEEDKMLRMYCYCKNLL